LEINLTFYEEQLRGEIFGDLTALQILNDSIEKNPPATNNYILQHEILLHGFAFHPTIKYVEEKYFQASNTKEATGSK